MPRNLRAERTLIVRPGQGQLPALLAEQMPYLDFIKGPAPESKMDRQIRLGRELFDACMVKDVEKVWGLVQDGADLNVRDPNGWTPLMWAVVSKKTIDKHFGFETSVMDERARRKYRNVNINDTYDTVNLLLKSRADWSLKNKDGDTATDIARREGCKEVVTLLERIYTAD